MPKRHIKAVLAGIVAALFLSGCGLAILQPSDLGAQATQNAIYAMQTAIVLTTQQAQPTQQVYLPNVSSGELTATPAPEATATPMPTGIPTIARTPTMDYSGLVTLTPVGICNAASAGEPFDITIPDGSLLLPGQKFEKVWRLVNSGTCTWNRLYKLVFYSQNSMDAYQEQLFGGEVQPGQAVDLKVQFTAPMEPGEYQSNWMLMDGDGNLFGVGTWADSPFWVNIWVVEQLPADATPVN